MSVPVYKLMKASFLLFIQVGSQTGLVSISFWNKGCAEQAELSSLKPSPSTVILLVFAQLH
jgi:hypothetical protein